MAEESQPPIQIINQVSPTPIQNNIPAPVVNNTSDDTQSKEANRIARLSLSINVVLSLLTFVAIAVSWLALDYAKSKDAKDYKERKQAEAIAALEKHVTDSINRRKDSITFENNNTSLRLAQQSLQAQIKTFNESQRQYELQHKPFLQLTGFGFLPSANGDSISLVITLYNLGKLPAKITSMKCTAQVNKSTVNLDTLINNGKEYHINAYISDSPFGVKTDRLKISKENSVKFSEGSVSLVFYGFIKYKDYSNKKSYQLNFIYNITNNDVIIGNPLKNETILINNIKESPTNYPFKP